MSSTTKPPMPSSPRWATSSMVMPSPPMELRRSLGQESGGAFFLILGAGAESEERRLQCQTLGLTGVQALVHRLERVRHGDGSVGEDFLQDGFSARDQLLCWYELVDQPDAIGFLGADGLSRENELQGPALADQPRQALGATAAREQPQGDFRLAEPGFLGGQPDGAGHGRLAAAAERKAVDRGDDRLAEVLDQVEHLLAEAARLLGLDAREV